jgi:hypothetical protein
MKKILLFTFVLIIGFSLAAMAGKKQGEKCFNDSECEFQCECNGGVCVKKKEWDYGSSGKSGNSCNNDADCINSGKCVRNAFGQGHCSGN